MVVLNAGAPIADPLLDELPGLVTMWYGGQEAGNALADVLFGDACPSGRLPQTWPVRLEDNPAHVTYPGERGRVSYGEGVFMGYRWYEKKALAPRFAFGHGLSYTEFAYGELRAQVQPDGSVDAAIDVTNTGARAGAEVVQLYVRDPEASVLRPEKELRAFARLELEPGATKTARFTLDRRAFAFWDPDARDWVVEPGAFELLAGHASDDVRARATIELA